MFTEALQKLALKIVPPPAAGSPVARRVIEEYKASGRIPRDEAQLTELRLVMALAVLLLFELVLAIIASAVLPHSARRAVVAVTIFFTAFILSGVVLHLVWYYRALFIYYREKRELKQPGHEFITRSSARVRSSDRDLILQAVVSAVTLVWWLNH
jgi:hypothetical protein